MNINEDMIDMISLDMEGSIPEHWYHHEKPRSITIMMIWNQLVSSHLNSKAPGRVLITTRIVSQAWHRLPMWRNRIGDMTSQCQPAPRCLMNCVTTQGNFKKDCAESGWVQPDIWYINWYRTQYPQLWFLVHSQFSKYRNQVFTLSAT